MRLNKHSLNVASSEAFLASLDSFCVLHSTAPGARTNSPVAMDTNESAAPPRTEGQCSYRELTTTAALTMQRRYDVSHQIIGDVVSKPKYNY